MFHVTDAWDTTCSRLYQVSLDLFWYETESLRRREGKSNIKLMSLEQETQLGVLGTPSEGLYTRTTQHIWAQENHLDLSRLDLRW